MSVPPTITIATRGSALALAQSTLVRKRCESLFPDRRFELKVIKTTGDRMQTMNLANPSQESTKGLFTKELEVALLEKEADFAVHSLKDLPTELPAGLILGAVSEREDPRDILIYRDREGGFGGRGFPSGSTLHDFPTGAVIATSSTRRQAQILATCPNLRTVPIRGNVGTRMQKLLDQPELDGILLAMAGLKRLGVRMDAEGRLTGEGIPTGCIGLPLPIEEMIPCVGQAALGIETRAEDPAMREICEALNHAPTLACVTAERAFLARMGGGCLSPVAAFAVVTGHEVHLRAISFRDGTLRRAEQAGPVKDARKIGEAVAEKIGG